jgi:hypothetical protein
MMELFEMYGKIFIVYKRKRQQAILTLEEIFREIAFPKAPLVCDLHGVSQYFPIANICV